MIASTSFENLRTSVLAAALLLAVATPVVALPADWYQLGMDIDGEAAGDQSGGAVAMSDDGNTVIVGASGNDGNGGGAGHVRVFRYDGATWNQLGLDIDGEAADDRFGTSVAMSGDGNTVIVGARWNDGNGVSAGHARVFRYDGAAWNQLGLDIDGEAAGDEAGWSVAMSSDGNTVMVGARLNDGNGSNSGHARVFSYDGANWNQVGLDIDGEAIDDQAGISVAMSDDGNTVIVGASRNDGNGADSGHARIFRYEGAAWNQLGLDIEGEAAGDFFAKARGVAMSSDGNTVIIGAFLNDDNGADSGHARAYRYDGATWNQLGLDIDGAAAGDTFGNSVAMSNDGNTVIVSANQTVFGGPGYAQVYRYDGAAWNQLGLDIDGEAAGDQFGQSVAMSSDGNTVIIGANVNAGNGAGAGHARVFRDAPIEFVSAWGSSGSGNGQFVSPRGIAYDASGNVYVADTGNDRIQKFDPDGNFLLAWGSSGAANGEFDEPAGLAIEADGNVLVADRHNHRIQRFDSEGNYLTSFGSPGGGVGQFNIPGDIALDPIDGSIWIVDTGNHRIMKHDSTGAFIRGIGWGVRTGNNAGETCTNATGCQTGIAGGGIGQFSSPESIDLDTARYIYVADTQNHRVQFFRGSDQAPIGALGWGVATGAQQFEICTGPPCLTGLSGAGTGQFSEPGGLAVDASGNIFVSDTLNDRIQKFDPALNYLAQSGTSGTGDGEFSSPQMLDVDDRGAVFVADSNADRIQRLVDAAQASLSFALGDIVLGSLGGPLNNKFWLVKLNPLTGQQVIFAQTIHGGSVDRLEWDDPRGGLISYNSGRLSLVDAKGEHTQIFSTAQIDGLASRGDGILYFADGIPDTIRYLDAGNVAHDLLDSAGTAPLSQGVQVLHYDAGTNALFCLFQPISSGPVELFKIPLNAAGTQAVGPTQMVSLPFPANAPRARSLSHLPSGDLLVLLKPGSSPSPTVGEWQQVDPVTLAVSTYANPGGFPGDGAYFNGTYSSLRDEAVWFGGSNYTQWLAEEAGGGGIPTLIATAQYPVGNPTSGGPVIEIPATTPLISIGDASGAEGDAGTSDFTFTVTLSSIPTAPVSVDYVVNNGTAEAPGDYVDGSGTLVIPAGVTSGEIVVQVVGDTDLEGQEHFFVELSNPVNGVIGDSNGVGAIVNDDEVGGAVPDGQSGGLPLRIELLGNGQLSFTWDASCQAGDDNFAIYEGTLGDFTSHVPLECDAGATPGGTFTPSVGARYYLVVPHSSLTEGSYGQASGSGERAASLSSCYPQTIASCQ